MDWSPLFVSLQTSTTATAIAFVFGVLLAGVSLRAKGFARAAIDASCTLPMVLPPTVLGYALLLAFGKNGPLGKLFLALGVRVVFSWGATVLAAVVVALPLVYRTARAAFMQIDPSLVPAARTLGMTERSIFLRVLIPSALPGLLAGTALAFARALGEFGATLMLAGNIPGKTQTIPVAIYFAAESGRNDLALRWVAVVACISLASVAALNACERRMK